MRKNIFFVALLSILLYSCEKSTNYSVQVASQQEKIEDYVKANGIVILKEYPKDSIFAENEYLWESSDSILFRLTKKGYGNTIEKGQRVNVRWVEYSIETGDSTSYWTTSDMPYPLELVYDPAATKFDVEELSQRSNTDCIGWQNALRFMAQSEAEADIIIPSPIGLKHAFHEVKAYRYKFTFKTITK